MTIIHLSYFKITYKCVFMMSEEDIITLLLGKINEVMSSHVPFNQTFRNPVQCEVLPEIKLD